MYDFPPDIHTAEIEQKKKTSESNRKKREQHTVLRNAFWIFWWHCLA